MKIRIIVPALFAIGLFSACATTPPRPLYTGAVPPQDPSPCASGKGVQHKVHPIVCIDDSVHPAKADPDEIFVAKKNRKNKPVIINFFTKSGTNKLDIVFKDTRCVTKEDCTGDGHCTAKMNPNAVTDEVCKYDIWVNDQKTDPTVIVQTCCL